jgi:hypothetical protein
MFNLGSPVLITSIIMAYTVILCAVCMVNTYIWCSQSYEDLSQSIFSVSCSSHVLLITLVTVARLKKYRNRTEFWKENVFDCCHMENGYEDRVTSPRIWWEYLAFIFMGSWVVAVPSVMSVFSFSRIPCHFWIFSPLTFYSSVNKLASR